MIKFVALFVLLLSPFARAANVATSDVTNQEQAKKWHILFDMNHLPPARDDQFASTDFTLFFDYTLNSTNTLRILQAPTKVYDLGGATRGENEWIASDTIISHFWNLPWTISATGTRFRLVSALNLPTSLESQDNQKILTFGHTLQMNTMVAGKLLVSLRPFYRYNWNRFRTSGPGDVFAGRPLPQFTYGLSMVNSYSISDALSLNASASWVVIYESASEFDNSTSLGGWVGENPAGTYSLSLTANYSWTEKFGTYIGYFQGAQYIQDGRYEVYAYDPRITRYSAGLTFYF